MMHTSAQGHALLHYFESCRLTAYPDPATGGAPWTIGWGDTGPGVVYGLTITQEQADARFATRLADEFEPGVRAVLTAPPEQHQFDAMVCLAYNIGLGNFRKSSVVRCFNAGDVLGAASAFLKWNRANGAPMLGLARRRLAEKLLFLGHPASFAIASAKTVNSITEASA